MSAVNEGWKMFADCYSKDWRVQWPALMRVAKFKSETLKGGRRYYWIRKFRSIKADLEAMGVAS